MVRDCIIIIIDKTCNKKKKHRCIIQYHVRPKTKNYKRICVPKVVIKKKQPSKCIMDYGLVEEEANSSKFYDLPFILAITFDTK